MASQHNNLYNQHKPEPGTRNIRLFRLDPRPQGSESSPLSGNLVVCCLDDPGLSYVALSYVWGNADLVATVIIANQEISVTASLSSALRHIHPPGSVSSLDIWADALCINQSDPVEKSWQVNLMSEIYRGCTEVLVFLPGPAPATPSAGPRISLSRFLSCLASGHFYRIPGYHIDTETGHVSFSETEDFQAAWEGFRLLAESAWWTRAWTAQEIILPPRATFLHAGAEPCDYRLLEDVDDNCWRHVFPSRRCCQDAVRIFPGDKMEILRLFIQKLWKIKCRRSAGTRRPDGRDDFYTVVRYFSDRKCQKPQDKIYSLLSQARKQCYREYRLDCSEPPATVFTDISALMLVEASESLVTKPWYDFSVLSGPGFGPSPKYPGKPSWAQDFAHDISDVAFEASIDRRGSYWLYRASGWNLGIHEVHGRELHLRGYKIDSIAWVGQPVGDVTKKEELGMAVARMLSMVRETDQLHENMARLLCADAYRSKLPLTRRAWRSATFVARELFHLSWYRIGRELGFQMMADAQRWRRALAEDIPRGAAWQKFLHSCDLRDTDGCYRDAVEVALNGRAFLITDSFGLMGLCEQANAGDEVWVVDGARLPFVLRPVSTQPGGSVEVRYQLIGDCFVLECMDGEYATSRQPRETIRII